VGTGGGTGGPPTLSSQGARTVYCLSLGHGMPGRALCHDCPVQMPRGGQGFLVLTVLRASKRLCEITRCGVELEKKKISHLGLH
jgi:hypothetical protein